jgi:hypothetical protein
MIAWLQVTANSPVQYGLIKWTQTRNQVALTFMTHTLLPRAVRPAVPVNDKVKVRVIYIQRGG